MTHSINSDKGQKPKALDREFLHCLAALFETYGPLGWWPADTDWEMMAGAILTQNTAWTNVEMALTNLKEAAGVGRFTAAWLLEQNPEDIKKWIWPSGFFNQKTPRLLALAHWFVSHGEDVLNHPFLYHKLTFVPGTFLNLARFLSSFVIMVCMQIRLEIFETGRILSEA